MVSLAVGPWWQQIVGVRWLPLAVGLIMLAFFIGVGWAMNQLSLLFIKKLMNEAAVWERAGMRTEVQAVFERVAALFDSFWLSFRQRRKSRQWITARLARFYLSQPLLGRRGRDLVQYHLQHYPQDQAAALSWLATLLTLKDFLSSEHYTVDLLAETYPEQAQFQHLLLCFYLKSGRTDFSALQVYQKAWHRQGLEDPEQLQALARLLLNEGRLNDWILALYLEAYHQGQTDCLAGIVAGARILTATPENQAILQKAKKIEASLEPSQCAALARPFQPVEEPGASRQKQAKRQTLSALGGQVTSQLSAVGRAVGQQISVLPVFVGRFIEKWKVSANLRWVVIGIGLFMVGAFVSVFGWRFSATRTRTETVKVPPPVQQLPPLTIDPFTIQVAAYPKAEDAERYAAQLKGHGLDAFWNEAISAKRKWFQVKISHFTTKSEAQTYGEQLKAKGLIDDFYVANFTPAMQKPSGSEKESQTEKP
jgi:hypothetical protein